MMSQSLLRPVTVAAVLSSLLWAMLPSAHAVNVSDAKVTLSKLSYKVTDTDTSDGVAAAVTIKAGQWDGTQLSIYDVAPSGMVSQTNQVNALVSGSVFDTGNKVVTLGSMPLARASKSGTTLTAQSGFTSAEARTILNGPYQTPSGLGGAYLGLQREANVGVSGSLGGLVGLAFELAPHSSVTFSGDFELATAVDMTALLNSDAFAKAKANNASLEVMSLAHVDLAIQHPDFGGAAPLASDGPQFMSADVGRIVTLDSLGRLTVSGDASAASGVLKVTFTNTSDRAVSKVLNYSLNADSYLTVISVPEPGTWALMGLGLAGVVVGSRQRRQA